MPEPTALEHVLRRDRAVVIGGLLGVTLLAWAYLLLGAGMTMDTMPAMDAMPASTPWSPGYAVLVAAMWAMMMVAMMLPSAAPMILLYATVGRRRRAQGQPVADAGMFAAGYVAVWVGFSLAMTMVQWGLDTLALLSPAMATTSFALTGAVLVAAGAYQWTPLKLACLRRCQSPLAFLIEHWREGRRGSLSMGLRHGLFCAGCCWALMLLLFVGGLMDLLWIAGIAIYVLLEKTVPAGPWLGRAAGLLLVAWGGRILCSLLA